jgi:DNA-binding MarR family transcriptional regulator
LTRVTIDQAIERIQFAYPQVYYACHTRHLRVRSSAVHLSERDSAILVHLDRATPTSLSELARHMGLAVSTLSEAVTRLETFGFLVKQAGHGGDRRHVGITLTPKAVTAVRAASVLDAQRLRAAMRRLSAAQRDDVITGLATLAQACRKVAK